MYNRRNFLKQSLLYLPLGSIALRMPEKPKITTLTKGPGFHWFGYYDKLQTDPEDRFILGMKTRFEGRSPRPDDVIEIGMVDTKKRNKWIHLSESRSWGWQQGCMLQWIPGSDREIIWNDRQNEFFVSRIMDVKTGKIRTLPMPVYALSPNGKTAVCTDFARLQNMRPGYGYPGVIDYYSTKKAPEETGIFSLDLETGEKKLIISYAEAAAIDNGDEKLHDYWHWFNHLLVNPSGTRFTFLHRWRKEMGDRNERASRGFITRMFTADMNGENRYIIDPSGYTSHFVWKDDHQICAWTRPIGMDNGFYLLDDFKGNPQPVGKGIMEVNGHNTYVPGTDNAWILNDTYPRGEKRQQTLYLFNTGDHRRVDLGHFAAPLGYTGEWRCDLHAKSTRDGKKVIFDSTHEGKGRQMYMMDISKILDG
jgi:hypothetical protein